MTWLYRFAAVFMFLSLTASQSLATYPQRVVAVETQKTTLNNDSPKAVIDVCCMDPSGANPTKKDILVRTSKPVTVNYTDPTFGRQEISLTMAIEKGFVKVKGDGTFVQLTIERGPSAPAGDIEVAINAGTIFGFRDGHAIDEAATARAKVLVDEYQKVLEKTGLATLNSLQRAEFLRRHVYPKYPDWKD